nr:assimilatory sulfite reductase (NADPH) flavoprotein subunit [Aliikangiella sp. G2MR2-5]
MLESVQQYDAKSLYWLSGYCSGLADARGKSPNAVNTAVGLNLSSSQDLLEQSNSAVALKTLVLFASQSGNAEKIATELHQSLEQSGLEARLSSVADIKGKEIKEQQVILLVASTHGEGEPPDDAIDFHEFVLGKRAPKLDGVKHAVLSLGDSSYEFFCQTGKDFDQAFGKLGSQPLIERVDCDLDYEAQAEEWINSITEKLRELTGSNPSSANSNQAVHNVAPDQWSKEKPFSATVLANQKITGRGSVKQIHHIELSLENSGIHYLPGDSLGVWAKNDEQTVNDILKLVELNGDEKVVIKSVERSLKQALIENLEITLLNKGLISDYAKLSGSDEVAKIVSEGYAEYVSNHQLIDLLSLAPLKLEAQQLVDLLKPIKPRMYSISSSLEANPEEVHLTVALAESENESGKRQGAASSFLLERLEEDDQVLVFVEENRHFKLPENDKPVLMIGPGTGIAPFRAFLQEREERQAKGGNWLFFGNPNFNTDFLYQTELLEALNSGVLNELSVAFSRDQEEKIYVQDRLKENAEKIWDWINSQGAYLYVCGDMNRMAKDVEATLKNIIQEQGNLSAEQADDYLKQLRKDKRYQRDVY